MTFWLWLLIGVALFDAFIVFALCRAASLSERATFTPRSDYSDFLEASERKVSRMHFHRTTRWREEVR